MPVIRRCCRPRPLPKQPSQSRILSNKSYIRTCHRNLQAYFHICLTHHGTTYVSRCHSSHPSNQAFVLQASRITACPSVTSSAMAAPGPAQQTRQSFQASAYLQAAAETARKCSPRQAACDSDVLKVLKFGVFVSSLLPNTTVMCHLSPSMS